MRIAQILNGKVHYIFKEETMPVWPPDSSGNIPLLIDITDNPEIQEGWHYCGETCTCTEPTQETKTEEPLFEPTNAVIFSMMSRVLEELNGLKDWEVGVLVKVGDKVNYETNFYVCIQEHITQADWKPSLTPSLWRVEQ